MSSAPPMPQPAPHKKTSPLIWILGGLAVVLFGGMLTCGLVGFLAMRAVKNAGFDPDLMKRNPGLAMAKMAATLHPDLEVVSTDDRSGKIVMRNKKDGKEVAFRFDPDKKTMVMTGDDGKDVTITASGEGADGRVTMKSSDSSLTFGAGGSAKMPDWVPVYPGTSPQGVYSANTPEGSQNTFTFKTNDSASKVAGYYQEQFKGGGLTVNLATSGDNGGLVTAESGDKKRTVVVTVAPANGVTSVSVMAVEKK
ncbi:MAG TPA: hypothetical protein VMB85_10520 [Bryobacteraceae bacterium]|jgi:hypothetical protein|nr:hypothetical protein [Bryobacteraceae bacterium]